MTRSVKDIAKIKIKALPGGSAFILFFGFYIFYASSTTSFFLTEAVHHLAIFSFQPNLAQMVLQDVAGLIKN